MIHEEKLKIQKEAFDALEKNNFRGIVILPTGTGKTYVLIQALRKLYKPGMRVLYTCDSKRLRDIGFNDELKKWDAGEFIDIIDRECYASAYKHMNEHYDILLADEGDYALTPEYSKLFFNNTFDHIIFVSATLDSSKVKYANKIAPVVYRKKIKEIEERKVVNKANFIYVPYRLNEKENKRYLQFNKRFRELLVQTRTPKIEKELDFLKIQRQHFLAGLESSVYICRKLMQELYDKDQNSRLLIFCGLNSQADKICKYTYHTDTEHLKYLDKFNEEQINFLAVCGKINRGENLKKVNTIILENCKSSETLMIQRTGRGRRLKQDEILTVYLLIPYFKTAYGLVSPTIVLDWAQKAGKEMGIENAKTHILK